MKCTCNAWKENDPHLTALFQVAKNQGIKYKGTPFIHCPWCGKELK